MISLKNKAVNGIFWSVVERFGNQIIQFVIGLILARLLMPKDYGLIGMLLVFISIAQVFVEGGFSSALIRKSTPTNADYSTVFWFNLCVAFLFYAIIFFCSAFIAAFYNEPLLILLAKIIALNIIISAFGIIQKTILTKQLNFKAQAKINIVAVLISGVVGVIAAVKGLGIWALVIQHLIRTLLMNIGYWIKSDWYPTLIFSKQSFKELFGFGFKLMLSSSINAISENLYGIIIGKLYDAKNLGFYSRANQFQKLPVSSVYGAIGAVSFPILAELKDDALKLKSAYQSMIRMVAFILFPVMGILAAVAEPMVKVILTDKWLPCVPLLQVLCLVGAFYPLHAINLDILKVKGRSDLFLKLEVVKQLLICLMIVICYKWGVLGLVWGSVALNLICYNLNAFYSKIIIGYGIKEQAKDLLFFILIVCCMLACLVVILRLLDNDWLLLFLIPTIGIISYILFSYIFKAEELFKLKHVFIGLIQKEPLGSV